MKNKEEPSIDLTRGNPSRPADQQIPGCQSVETTGSIVRQDGIASAWIETPALSLFTESSSESAIDQSKIEHWLTLGCSKFGVAWQIDVPELDGFLSNGQTPTLLLLPGTYLCLLPLKDRPLLSLRKCLD